MRHAFFELAIRTVLENEGGLTTDHAGVTNYGITIPVIREACLDVDGDGDIDADDIKGLSEEQAIQLYFDRFWVPAKLCNLTNATVAEKTFDCVVNMGIRQGVKILQRACRACGLPLVEDGILGRKTAEAANSMTALSLFCAMRSEQAGFYRVLATKNRSKYGRFLKGWLARAYR